MSSPITLSGFNNIDFNSVLNALMAQERLPVNQLTSQRTALTNQRTFFSTFGSGGAKPPPNSLGSGPAT